METKEFRMKLPQVKAVHVFLFILALVVLSLYYKGGAYLIGKFDDISDAKSDSKAAITIAKGAADIAGQANSTANEAYNGSVGYNQFDSIVHAYLTGKAGYADVGDIIKKKVKGLRATQLPKQQLADNGNQQTPKPKKDKPVYKENPPDDQGAISQNYHPGKHGHGKNPEGTGNQNCNPNINGTPSGGVTPPATSKPTTVKQKSSGDDEDIEPAEQEDKDDAEPPEPPEPPEPED